MLLMELVTRQKAIAVHNMLKGTETKRNLEPDVLSNIVDLFLQENTEFDAKALSMAVSLVTILRGREDSLCLKLFESRDLDRFVENR